MTWFSKWYPAKSDLSSVLKGIWSVHSSQQRELAARILPNGTTCLVLLRDTTSLITQGNAGLRNDWSGFDLSGPQSNAFDMILKPSSQILIVHLQPLGVMKLFSGMPTSEIYSQHTSVESILSKNESLFFDHNQDDAMVEQVESWIRQRLARQEKRISDVVEFALQTIELCHGNIEVMEVARRADISRRQLSRLFKSSLGLTPKQYLRIIRFQEAVQLARFQPHGSWSEIAYRTGFADQSHLIRDFSI